MHEGSSGIHVLLYDIFPMHDIRVDKGRSQMGVKVKVEQEDQQGPTYKGLKSLSC
jgi:hypothetical protein